MELIDNNGVPTKEFYIFLRYNQLKTEVKKLASEDKLIYEEFCKKWTELKNAIENNSSIASAIFGSILSIFGFGRHYCSTCGLPIVGKYSKVGNRVTCAHCFAAHRVIQKLGKREEIAKNQTKLIESINNSQKSTESKGES